MKDLVVSLLAGGLLVAVCVWAVRSAAARAREFAEWAARHGTTVESVDDGALEERLAGAIGLPRDGQLRDLVHLPAVAGDLWLFTRLPSQRGHRTGGSSSSHSGDATTFLLGLRPVPLYGRVFVTRQVAFGAITMGLVEFVLSKVFGADGIRQVKLPEAPELEADFAVFAEDEATARALLLAPPIRAYLTRSRWAGIATTVVFGPGGFGFEIGRRPTTSEGLDEVVRCGAELLAALEEEAVTRPGTT